MKREILSLLLIFVLLATEPASAIASDFSQSQAQPQEQAIAQPGDSFEAFVSGSSAFLEETTESTPIPASCNLHSLTPEEVQRLQELWRTGKKFSEINAGTPADTSRDALEKNQVFMPDKEGNLAIQQELPSKKFSASEVSWMQGKRLNGPFALGISISDTLRTARCEGDAEKNCSVREKGQSLKNDGSGIAADFKNISKDLQSIWEDQNLEVEQDELALLTAEALSDDMDETGVNVKIANRVAGSPLPNAIEADNFSASMETTCENAGCLISTYSMFDKYFNSWFSANMVITNFGPTVLGKTAKLFKWTSNRFSLPFAGKLEGFYKNFRQTLGAPNTLVDARAKRITARKQKYNFEALTDPPDAPTLTKGDDKMAIVSSKKFADWEKWAYGTPDKPEGALTKLLKTYEQRRAWVNQVKDYKAISNIYNLQLENAKAMFAARKISQLEYGREVAKIMKAYDDTIQMNLSKYLAKIENSGLRSVGVKNVNSNYITTWDIEDNAKYINKEFAENVRFTKFGEDLGGGKKSAFAYETDGLGNIKVYKLSDKKLVQTNVLMSDFEQSLRTGTYVEKSVKLDTGDLVPATADNLDYIRANTRTGRVNIYDKGWDDAGVMSPDDYVGKILGADIPDKIGTATKKWAYTDTRNMEIGFQSRRYYSALDKLMLEDESIVKNYFDVMGGGAIKWTAYPFGYWFLKKGVGGFTPYSAYRLPETWSEIKFYNDEEAIYNDAYIDFFANAGSDQGDIFVQILNYLPWKLVLDKVSQEFNPVDSTYKRLTGEDMRNETENLAVYVRGPQECSSCTLNTLSGADFKISFVSGEKLESFILEDTQTEKSKEIGQTLIAFSHHSNIEGKSMGENGDKIDLVDAEKNKTTCMDAVKELPIGFGKLAELTGRPATTAAVMGITEALAYMAFGLGPGLFASAAQQIILAPKLNDCVDDLEGYFVHFFIPTEAEDSKNKRKAEINADTINKVIQEGKDRVSEYFESEPAEEKPEEEKTPLDKAMESIKDKVDTLVESTKQKNTVQAHMEIFAPNAGILDGKDLFMFWFKGTLDATTYKTQGKMNFVDASGNILSIDYSTGQVTMNGKQISSPGSEDHYRLGSTSTEIPAQEIPNRLGYISLPGADEIMFEISNDGKAKAVNAEVLNCIERAVLDQTGVSLNEVYGASEAYNLMEAFGLVNSVSTNAYSIYPQVQKISLEGTPRIAVNAPAKITIFGSRDTNVSNAERSVPAGKMESIVFENGSIVYKPETNQLIVWLKRHGSTILKGSEIKNLKAKLSSAKNPETDCEEPAIDLSIEGNLDSPNAMAKADAMNKALEKMGPYQVFDTDKKTFIFYSDADCVPHFRVIDKLTGEVYDQAIKEGTLQQTPTGIKFQTEDGKNHDLSFSADNGRPTLDYNGELQTLLAAQGRNGAFWYDPEKGLWYADNAQLIPLADAFKQKGITVQVDEKGNVTGTPATNVFVQQPTAGKDLDLFNLPSIPEQQIFLVLFLVSAVAAIALIRVGS